MIAVPADHSMVRNTKEDNAIAISSLADEHFVVYGRRDGFGLCAATVMACHAAGFAPRFSQEAPDLRLPLAWSLPDLESFSFLDRFPMCVWAVLGTFASKCRRHQEPRLVSQHGGLTTRQSFGIFAILCVS